MCIYHHSCNLTWLNVHTVELAFHLPVARDAVSSTLYDSTWSYSDSAVTFQIDPSTCYYVKLGRVFEAEKFHVQADANVTSYRGRNKHANTIHTRMETLGMGALIQASRSIHCYLVIALGNG